MLFFVGVLPVYAIFTNSVLIIWPEIWLNYAEVVPKTQNHSIPGHLLNEEEGIDLPIRLLSNFDVLWLHIGQI